MSKRQLILHIGMPKTGSTSIQDFFKANAGPLEEKGYVYLPKRGRVWPRLMDKSVNFRDKISFDEQWAPIREALLKDNKSVIFSDEGLLHAFTQDWTRLEKIQSYLDGVEVVVVLYLRRQDLHMESAYKEGLKQFDLPVPFSPDIIRDIWGEKYHHYYDHVCRLVDLVGKENLRLQVYERERFPERNVVLDFCTLVGIELDASFVFPERVSNPSIDARLLDYYGVFNSQWEVHDSAGQVFNELLTLAGNEIFEKNDGRILSPPERTALLEQYEDSNSKVAKAFWGTGELFSAPAGREMQDVVAMSGTEHAQLARYIHGTWSDGVGAMPLSLYLFKKLNYLRQARDMAKGAKKISFSTRLFLFFLLFSIVNGLSLKKFNRESSAIDKKIAHYLVRWRKLVAKRNT